MFGVLVFGPCVNAVGWERVRGRKGGGRSSVFAIVVICTLI